MRTQHLSAWLLTLGVVLAAAGAARCARTSGSADVAATIGDLTITLADVDQRWSDADPASRMQVRQQTFDARTQALEQIVAEHLIEREARRRGIPAEQLLDVEIPKRTPQVTEAEIVAAYREAGDQVKDAKLDDLRPRIRDYLQEHRYGEALRAFVNELRQEATDVRVNLEPPRLAVQTAPTDPGRGPATAPVTIVEFSDFQCPYCRQAAPTLKKIQETFGDRVRLVYRDAPLPTHPEALVAAEAAQCAHDQGKFWEYHDVLFANQQALQRARLREYAAVVGLDERRFSACLDGGRFRADVERDLGDAQAYGIASTPTFFVNGRVVMGALPYERLEQIVEEELARHSVSR